MDEHKQRIDLLEIIKTELYQAHKNGTYGIRHATMHGDYMFVLKEKDSPLTVDERLKYFAWLERFDNKGRLR